DGLGAQRLCVQPAQIILAGGYPQDKGLALLQPLLEMFARQRAAKGVGDSFVNAAQDESLAAGGTFHALEQGQPIAARIAPDQPGSGVLLKYVLDILQQIVLKGLAHERTSL